MTRNNPATDISRDTTDKERPATNKPTPVQVRAYPSLTPISQFCLAWNSA
ncbi:MAG: hypothetical protein FWE28_05505 [Oscillospiraceae bacterium]|nr:hypothetical protein [Oscillospiraceae bacterium]